jgi:phospholipase D1/2
VVTEAGNDVAQRLGNALDPQAYAEYGQKPQTEHRFGSFAPPREANDVKWYVDGCSYFYAVSKALESARESIWILDCELLLFCLALDVDVMLLTDKPR